MVTQKPPVERRCAWFCIPVRDYPAVRDLQEGRRTTRVRSSSLALPPSLVYVVAILMKWASSIATSANLSEAILSAAADVRTQLEGRSPDLVTVFVSPAFSAQYEQIPALLQEHLPSRHLLGCSGGGVIGGGCEVENKPAISITAALLPDVELKTFHSDSQNLPDLDASPEVWRSWLGMRDWGEAHFVVLADPFTTSIEPFLNGLDFAFPSGAKVGGLASGARAAGENAIFLDAQCHRSGLAAIALRGNVIIDTIVAQGCRPIGTPLTITKCTNNMLIEVDHQPPLQYLGDLIETLSDYDKTLMKSSLFLGMQMDPFASDPRRGDFMIRNLIGIDYQRGVLAVGALLQEGQRVQFHLRDKITSSQDLDSLLIRYASVDRATPVAGALLFSCLGRGQYLYGRANHDSNAFLSKVRAVPIGGFFCNGEIGPVGNTTYVHGYTSSFGVFRPASAT